MLTSSKPWWILGAVLLGTFLLLGLLGREIYRQAPPIPQRIVTEDGQVLATADTILDGQQVWQSLGGQQVGSIWGHGAYQAPDWSADWLHRECLALLERWSQREHGAAYATLHAEAQAGLRERLRGVMRENRYDPATGDLTLGADRAAALQETAAHYTQLFGGDPALAELREDYALRARTLEDPARLEALGHFFFWTSWACAAERLDSDVSYTNDWPHEPLVGNAPTSASVVWSLFSVFLLLGAIGGLVWWRAHRPHAEDDPTPPATDPLDRVQLTPSMRAVGKYCAVVLALFVVQVLLGALTAHYTVEGDAFFGLPLAEWLPYSVTRTWHIQTALFWIATSFLAAGLFLAPLVGGREPRYQRLGVNVLFGALLLVVVGSLAGEWVSIHQHLGLDAGFWFGHQGYEYVELGRFWQLLLFGGLGLWLVLMLRGLWPALTRTDGRRQLVLLFAGSSAAIGLFYGAGLLYGARTHLSVAEYWRWWVVHLWVEGFMEVFATVSLAFLFSQLGLIRAGNGARAVLASAALFLLGGIPGTFHHLYFSGTPVSIMAVGATFSALEVVPLVLIGHEAYQTLRMGRMAPWMRRYRWPLTFFVAVAFWNLVGAGLFGFLINPPLALYYMQGLNTTPVHGHAALFGVYGLLSLGLVLVVLRRLAPEREWRDGSLRLAFWGMNVGLALMIALSLLPVGIVQTVASVETGLWYARSAELLQQPFMETLRWLRIVGDTVFLFGVANLIWFALGLLTGRSYVAEPAPADDRQLATAAA
ncbi:MAG: nitric-oxide reductase large subunit [Planctomycetota bacterium]